MNIYERASQIGLGYIKTWLPDGYEEHGQWVALNPLRNDTNKGSFKINESTGAFRDYADDEMVGKDAVTLYAKLNGLSNFEAAETILEKYDPSYFPGTYTQKEISETWNQVTRPRPNAPELPKQNSEVARWPLEVKHGDKWLPVMWIIRLMKNGRKADYPYTLYTDSKNYEWRCKALHGVKYPLYNARSLEEKPNARVLLVEGQKVASVVKDLLTSWAVVGWYGGAQSIGLSNLSALNGREVYFSFDADTPGRQAIEKIKKLLPNTKIKLVFPPNNVTEGWDLADAVKDGWTEEQLEKHILKDEILPPEPVRIAPCMSPLKFTSITEDEKFRIRSIICEEKNTGVNKQTGEVITKTVLKEDWIGLWVENDVQLLNSIMQDYTTGLKDTAYDNKNDWLGAVEMRADQLEIPQSSLTKQALEKIERAISIRGKKYNRVADYIDTLKSFYPDSDASVLDEFMNVFTFEADVDQDEDIDDIFNFYKQLFHKFFLRMHGRINGTRRDENGNYIKSMIPNDIVPVLVGSQGRGKTLFCRWLATDNPSLYCDLGSGLKMKFGSAETVKKIRGTLIAEIGEMKVMRNVEDVEQVKSFISSTTQFVDLKYVEAQYETPLTCSFIGTSNAEQFLSDTTGNRRWFPVKIKDMDRDKMTSEEGRTLIKRLHSYYSRLTSNMTSDEIVKETQFTREQEAFIDKLRTEALITYSDYEACCVIITKWINEAEPGTELLMADVERLCYEAGYKMRIAQKSCQRAMIDCGLEFASINRSDSTKKGWIKPFEKKPEEELPF